jgi:hypothetical protein
MKKIFIVFLLFILATTAFAADKTIRIIDKDKTEWLLNVDQITAVRSQHAEQWDVTGDGTISNKPGRITKWFQTIIVLFNSAKETIYITIEVSDKTGPEVSKLLDQIQAKMNGNK